MFEEGNIIYFTPFYFKNGNSAKPKYFVVLKNENDINVLASLPTRKDFVPEKNVIENGCVELPEINFNCFVISDQIQVTECGKVFDFKTHIYGHQIDIYEVHSLKEIYPIENTDYEVWGKMKKDIFVALIDCLKTSRSVKQKLKKILGKV